jgi:DNA (cytosine-5)-methyltransferase 1
MFSGVGGLDMAVEPFFDAETVWHCEWDENPSKVLAAHWPGVPNLGDITTVDWSTVEPVDIVCGGSPCQDVSAAGPRTGMTEGTRSNLWVHMREAIAYLKPSVVIWENVRGALSAYAFSSVESDPGLLGEYGPDRPALRAAGRVVGDLSALGYDAVWTTVPASDVGAPHRRERVFVLAYAQDVGHERGWPTRNRGTGPADGDQRAAEELTLLPTPTVTNGHGNGYNGRGELLLPGVAMSLLPTPVTHPETGNGHARNLCKEIALLPTPQVADATGGHANRSGARSDELLLPGIAREVVGQEWAGYTPAVRRWEALTRPAPAPTRPDGKNDRHRMSPQLPEWMMGYPLGWVTDILEREPAIKACGNGVVPQQGFYALSILWPRVVAHLKEVAA